MENIKSENCEIENCGICISQLGEGYECKLECGHEYHMDCIFEWFNRDKSCPMCRGQVSDETIEYLCEKSDDQYSYENVDEPDSDDEDIPEDDDDAHYFDMDLFMNGLHK